MIYQTEHEELIRTIKKFVVDEINIYVDDWEDAGSFPAKELFRKMANIGLLGISKSETFGGLGLDFTYEIAFAEAISTALAGGIPLAVGVQTNMATPALANFGSDELRREFLAPALAGDMVCSIAVSEPDAGSDVAAIKTTARKQGDDYIINGSKMWITNSTQADWFCLLANTSEGSRHTNKSLIIVPTNLPGVTVGNKLKKMGMRSSDTAPVFFDNVRVPQRYLIGEEGKGFAYQMQQFEEERLFGAAMAVSQLETCVKSTIQYTQERQAFGQPLINNQSIHFSLAEMQTEIEALRSLVYRAVYGYINGENVSQLASMAKLKAGRLSRTIPDSCLQFWGGMGYVEESIINRFYRDCRLIPIGGGVDEVMLGIITKKMGLIEVKR